MRQKWNYLTFHAYKDDAKEARWAIALKTPYHIVLSELGVECHSFREGRSRAR
jgi:hypothetical protein